jgi:lipid A 3-O-deacylase
MGIKYLIAVVLAPLLLYADCPRPGLLSLGVGTFDTIRPHKRMAQYQAEYKWSASWHGIQPMASLMVSQKGSAYFCLGACYDIYMGRHWVLTPSFAPGLYLKNKGKDLGFPLEFRSSLAIAFEFNNGHRMGLQFYHLSNANLGSRNPGEESLVLFYSIAFF